MITGLPGATGMKPGSASLPFFGIVPAIVDEEGNELTGECDQGYLVGILCYPITSLMIFCDDLHDFANNIYHSSAFYCFILLAI